jgi:ribosome modulation factor
MNQEENKAWNNGLDAQIDGVSEESNPYPEGSSLYNSWEMGWQQGADEDFEEDMNRE